MQATVTRPAPAFAAPLGRPSVQRRRPAISTTRGRTVRRVAPVCASDLRPPLGDGALRFGVRHWGEGLRDDLRRRAPLYWSDWKDGIHPKTLPAVMFLYFACLAPVVAFGGLTAVITDGTIGVVDFFISASAGGMFYAIASGQPLTIIAPTGLTLAFTSSLYVFCKRAALPFLATYAWVGIWTSAILLLLAVINASDLIRHCTRFTDDVFNSLIATNFVYEAVKSITGNFKISGPDKTRPFMALSLSLGTYILGRSLSEFRRSRYLHRTVRDFVSDFGPSIAILTMSALAASPAVRYVGLDTLQVPAKIALEAAIPSLVSLQLAPMSVRILAVVPALLLTCLFFLDQNISVRVVNSPAHKLRKSPAYHLDLLVLSICTLVSSLFGLPWMCAGTPQSLNHIRALALVSTSQSDRDGENRAREHIETVVENRLTGFVIHFAIGASIVFLFALRRIPLAVISGLFLYLGRNMMSGNEFLQRIRLFFVDPGLVPEGSPLQRIRATKVHLFTAVQLACLTLLWVLKLNRRTSLFFPSVIGTLMVIRSFVLVHWFSGTELHVLDAEIEGEASESMNTVDSGMVTRYLDSQEESADGAPVVEDVNVN